jgi:hypothetical protein
MECLLHALHTVLELPYLVGTTHFLPMFIHSAGLDNDAKSLWGPFTCLGYINTGNLLETKREVRSIACKLELFKPAQNRAVENYIGGHIVEDLKQQNMRVFENKEAHYPSCCGDSDRAGSRSVERVL